MRRFVVCTFLLILMSSCVPDKQPRHLVKPVLRSDAFVVFLTGYELGELKPCGCTGGQLGGLDRRWAVLNSVPKQRKLTIDIGSFVESDSEQDLIKFSILIQAFGLLDYDVVNLTRKDLEIAQNLGLLFNPVVRFINPYGAGENIAGRFQSQYLLNGKSITISVLTVSIETSPIEQIREVFTNKNGQQVVNILIIDRYDEAVVSSIAQLGIVDCLVFPSDADEPRVVGDSNKQPLVISVGRFGRYVCALQIAEEPNESIIRNSYYGEGQDKLKLDFDIIAITEDLSQGSSLVRLYKNYQQLIKDADLLEKFPRFSLPNGLRYEGSKSCNQKGCHDYEYKIWSKRPHAKAYATLVKVGSQYDPECVVCHVVGMDYESGYISEEKAGHLKNVGCENCHGPGSEHNRTEGLAKTKEPKMNCLYCHTPEKSPEYIENEQEYLEKIRHWVEPNTDNNVKQ